MTSCSLVQLIVYRRRYRTVLSSPCLLNNRLSSPCLLNNRFLLHNINAPSMQTATTTSLLMLSSERSTNNPSSCGWARRRFIHSSAAASLPPARYTSSPRNLVHSSILRINIWLCVTTTCLSSSQWFVCLFRLRWMPPVVLPIFDDADEATACNLLLR